MTTILKASPRRFVSTPAVERVATRALRYLQSGFSVHLRGPAGTGKTTMALHLADLLARPIMLIFGDDEFKTSDLIGNQSGYTRKKVVDNFIHSVVKVEDELRQNWVDSRLTLACREGFTLVYDEFNRSRPEVNNVLLSALEEKLLVLPPSNNRSEYIRVSPNFRGIFTSNPEEYCGVHATQDALLDRLVTINMPEPDELTQQEILVQKTEINRVSALFIVRLVNTYRKRTGAEKVSGLRSCLMLAKVCQEHGILVTPENPEFRDICSDVLLSRSGLHVKEATEILWDLLNEFISSGFDELEVLEDMVNAPTQVYGEEEDELAADPAEAEVFPELIALKQALNSMAATLTLEEPEAELPEVNHLQDLAADTELATVAETETVAETVISVPYEQEVYTYLQQSQGARLSQIEQDLGLDRFHTVDAIRSLTEKGLVVQRDRLFILTQEDQA